MMTTMKLANKDMVNLDEVLSMMREGLGYGADTDAIMMTGCVPNGGPNCATQFWAAIPSRTAWRSGGFLPWNNCSGYKYYRLVRSGVKVH